MTIRRVPEDFRVEELLEPAVEAAIAPTPGPHALYLLKKTGYTTPQALADMARALQVRQADLSFVGLKDKHAVTAQYVTVPTRPGAADLKAASWSATRLGYLPQPLTAEMVRGNRFALVVRDISREDAELMDHCAQALRVDPTTCLVVNYFGDQRFGSARHQEGFAGPLLIQGDFLGALKLLIATPSRKDKKETKAFRKLLAAQWGDWKAVLPRLPRCADRRAVEILAHQPQAGMEAFASLPYFTQQMCVYAYQSYLWNQMARKLIEAGAGQACYEAEDAFGTMLFPRICDVSPSLRDMDLPVPGRNTQPGPEWKSAAQAVLAEEKLTSFQDLRIPGLRRPFFGEAERKLFMRTTDFALGAIAKDELGGKNRVKREVRFCLPRGGYATVALRALGQ